jgi:hypothetical protein
VCPPGTSSRARNLFWRAYPTGIVVLASHPFWIIYILDNQCPVGHRVRCGRCGDRAPTQILAQQFRTPVHFLYARSKITRISLHKHCIFDPIVILVHDSECPLQSVVVLPLWVYDQASGGYVMINLSIGNSTSTYLPPRTLVSPENTFDKLLTITSASGSTSTLAKLPIVSSTTIMNPYCQSPELNQWRASEQGIRREFTPQRSNRITGGAVSF